MSKIAAIRKMVNYGIFRKYSNAGVDDFARLNLFYGWNGSGKSTLSTLFERLEHKEAADTDRFVHSQFEVLTETNIVWHENIAQHELNIRTFNQNFIKNNIDWNKSVRGILLVAKERIEEKKELERLRIEQESMIEASAAMRKSIESKTQSLEKFLTSSAKRTKISLQVIDTKDSRYLNYNRTKLEEFISANGPAVRSTESILSVETIASLTQSAKPDIRPRIELPEIDVKKERFQLAFDRLQDLLATSATNGSIERLAEHGDILQWVAAGRELHAKYESQHCEFCGADFTRERRAQLEAHFNQEFFRFQQRLVNAAQWLGEQYINDIALPSEMEVYEELRAEYSSAAKAFFSAKDNLNREIALWEEILKKKTANQFDVSLTVGRLDESLIEGVGECFKGILAVVARHNQKTANFDVETKISKQKLELHYAASEVREFEYFNKVSDLQEDEKKSREIRSKLAVLGEAVRKLESSLSSEGVGAEYFNAALHRFLGRNELSLRFKAATSGYEIVRENGDGHDTNLSEGEKTAIAFIYFITKLTENENKIENTIVVVDDPISSFDSNHLFHAYSFLRSHCESAKQLFVFTHNFNFYKLVRDWFDGTNKNKANRDRKNGVDFKPTAHFYIVESAPEKPRSSSIKNARESLTKYHSEYHYLYSKLHEYKQHASLSMEEAFLTANLARKLLETFFVFKYPRQRSDFSALLKEAQKSCERTTPIVADSIYRFINKYSHNDVIEMNYDAAENLQGESQNMIAAIFDWIEEIDSVHFSEMNSVISET